MLGGFEKIVEERIKKAMKEGQFDDLPGSGKPLLLEDDRHIPEDLRLAYKILKNADCVPPEIEVKKEITRAEDLLSKIEDATQKYRAIRKLNFLVTKFNTLRNQSVMFELPQRYAEKVIGRCATGGK